MDITTETFERDVIERSREVPVVTGFVGAQPASAIGRFFDEVVLAEQTGEGDPT